MAPAHAHFHSGDPDELVAASLACRYCLRAAAAVEVEEDELGALAVCHCLVCPAASTVLLDHDQLLRVVLRPPDCIDVRMRSSR